ncbi:MAG: EMC3/TMCO1 family protein [Candidatus Methanomethylophilaceae archaeon]|jgi:uncharacterized membrane protein (DUF106 family)
MAETPKPNGKGAPQAPSMSSMMPMLIVLIMIMALYMIDGSNHYIGKLLNYVFQIIDFDGQYAVLTLMLMGVIMTALSTIIRSFTMDPIAQTKSQQFMSSFNKELRQARIENNLYKVKKLEEMQSVVMAKSMESSTQMMKSMPYTMIVIVPIFLWVRYFVDVTLAAAGTQIISIPWSVVGVNLMHVFWFMPAWILVYTLVSIPLGQLVMKIIRTYQFKKRLHEIESESETVEVA